MNEKYRRLPATFEPETRFEVLPLPAAPFRALQDDPLERLKTELLAKRLEEAGEPEVNSLLRRAANEAAAVAWLTPYPTLVFPVLFEEKSQAALLVADRQLQVRQRSRELLAV